MQTGEGRDGMGLVEEVDGMGMPNEKQPLSILKPFISSYSG